MIRVAAVGDLHVGPEVAGTYRGHLTGLADQADVFLVAGDLTRHGTVEEGRVAAGELRDLGVPVVAVLGNHDYHSDAEEEIADVLRDAGVTVLEGDGTVLDCGGTRLGVAGGKGFGGGFEGKCASDFGEPEMKAFIRHTRDFAARLNKALTDLDADVVISLTHYSPAEDTLAGEPPAATCWGRRSTRPGRTSPCTVTRTGARRRALHPAGSGYGTSLCPCSSTRTRCTAWTNTGSPPALERPSPHGDGPAG